MSEKPWLESWEEGKALEPGGQGATKVVRSKTDDRVGVLKVLHKDKDPDRRRRMHREAEALRTLSHAGVARLYDSNTMNFEGTTRLFIVTEYIPGSTVAAAVLRKRFSLDEAVVITTRLVEAVAHCHKNNTGHRDIKPDNIILRGDSNAAPVLIDFGLSFNLDDDASLETPSEQQVGNRFLALPELTTPGSEKRDPRSDLTFCCAIFYFALSGLQPMTLRDEKGAPPHERRGFQEMLAALPERTRLLTNLLLGRGFKQNIAERFQTPQELLAALEGLQTAPEFAGDSANILAAIHRAQNASKQATQTKESRIEALADHLRTYLGPIRSAIREGVAKRVADKVPIRELPVTLTDWKEIARGVLTSRAATIFEYECVTPGIRGFKVRLTCEPKLHDDESPLKLQVRLEPLLRLRDPSMSPWTGADYLLYPSGKFTLIQASRTVGGDDIVQRTLSSIDDDAHWSVPEAAPPIDLHGGITGQRATKPRSIDDLLVILANQGDPVRGHVHFDRDQLRSLVDLPVDQLADMLKRLESRQLIRASRSQGHALPLDTQLTHQGRESAHRLGAHVDSPVADADHLLQQMISAGHSRQEVSCSELSKLLGWPQERVVDAARVLHDQQKGQFRQLMGPDGARIELTEEGRAAF